MLDLLRKGFDALNRHGEKREERYDRLITKPVDAMSHRPTLKRYIYVFAALNTFLWACVLLRPFDVLAGFQKVAEIDDRLLTTIFVGLFGVGMWLTYSLFRLKFPGLEDRKYPKEVFSAYRYQADRIFNFRIWVTSVTGGVLNLLALAIVEGLLVSN